MILRTSLQPGDIGDIAGLHARQYALLLGFGVTFEALVARGLAEFALRDDPSSCIWIVRDDDGALLGSIASDLSAGPDDAHLRWFLLAPRARGTGLGRQLLDAAVAWGDAHGARRTELTTVQGLDAARAMYERRGFRLTREEVGDSWGTRVTEQTFTRISSKKRSPGTMMR